MKKPLALIIEDNEDVAIIFSEAAKDAGYQTEIAEAGDLALERLADLVPDLVILDLHLPRIQGTEVLAQIRADPRLTATKVILATADSRRAEILQDKADLVLLKPVGYYQLRDLASRLGGEAAAQAPE